MSNNNSERGWIIIFNQTYIVKKILSKKEIGKRISTIRKLRNLRPVEVYRCLGISSRQYACLESGSYQENTDYYYYCFRISQILQMNLSYLFLNDPEDKEEFRTFFENVSIQTKKIMTEKMLQYFTLKS